MSSSLTPWRRAVASIHRSGFDTTVLYRETPRTTVTGSAIARMDGGGVRPTLETLERLATAVGSELVVGVDENLSDNPGIAELVRDGHAVVRRAG